MELVQSADWSLCVYPSLSRNGLPTEVNFLKTEGFQSLAAVVSVRKSDLPEIRVIESYERQQFTKCFCKMERNRAHFVILFALCTILSNCQAVSLVKFEAFRLCFVLSESQTFDPTPSFWRRTGPASS